MKTKYIIKRKGDNQFLARGLFRGYYLTEDITKAIKQSKYDNAMKTVLVQDIMSKDMLTVMPINVA